MLEIEKRDWRCSWLDLLRTFLAFYVVFAHAVPWTEMLQGHAADASSKYISDHLNGFAQPHGETNLAVLAFIVLSGYCIHRSGMSDGLRNFAIRRIFRIVPIYIAASIFGVIVFWLGVQFFPAIKHASSTTAVSAPCLAVKLSTMAAIFPSLSSCAFQGNAPIRTVAAEMWLYAAYPVGLLLIRRLGERVLWMMLTAVALIGSFYAGLTSHVDWWHNDSFAGFLLYWWIGAKSLDRKFAWSLLFVFPLTLTLWIGLSGIHSIIAIELRQLSVALMIAAALPLIDVPRHSRITETLGRAGYSIYAFHAPIVYIALSLEMPWQAALLVAGVFGISAFYLIERPLDRIGRDITKLRPLTKNLPQT
jgi:peptidoglycan/LPS O-acetylase OafA/YrhL